jgi:hypothetical protein
MLLPEDNAFGIIKPSGGTPQIDTSNPGAFMQSAIDTIVSRYENQYVKQVEAEKKKKEQERLNDELTNTFNSAIKYYRDRIESMNALNFHRRQEKKAYKGVHNQAGIIVKNESFFTEDFLFIKVLFKTDWGSYRFIPPDLQADRAQGFWAGETPVQLIIDDPPHIPLLASVYTYVPVDGRVRLCQMPIPLYTQAKPDALPDELYLYLFYAKPRGVE